MARLNMVIADMDEDYIRGLSHYINSNHSTTFIVSCFTRQEALSQYLEQYPVDILIVSPDIFAISGICEQIGLKIVLSQGVIYQEYPGFQVLSKYCTGERFISDILYLYSQINPDELRISTYSKNAKLIGVYSAAGGTGKTTVAAALSMQCKEMGKCSFYLNLESVQSTGIFFKSDAKRNLSYVFYYLKENCNNLSFRMDGIKSTDSDCEVKYFEPPDNLIEYEDIGPKEAAELLRGIKAMGCYDFIFIDMTSVVDRKNLSLLELCDQVVFVTLQDPIVYHKDKLLRNQLEKLYAGKESKMLDKFIIVENKCKDSYSSMEGSLPGSTVDMRIPAYSQAFINEKHKLVIKDEGFYKAINLLISEILQE